MRLKSAGWGSGLLGVIIFSGSLPATRVAVSGFDPVFLTSARAVIASILAAMLLFILRQPRPARQDLKPLLIVAVGVVVGFPLLTALALQTIDSAHSIVFIGLLPLATALFAVVRAGERHKLIFWIFSGSGSALVVGFAVWQGVGGSLTGDFLMLAAILLCGLGYAEGAALSRRLGGWQVISWALLVSAPTMTAVALFFMPREWSNISYPAWIGLGYVSVFSMLIGFVFWYRGLAIGGIAGVGQLQLLQPFLGFLLASLVLGEQVTWLMLAVAFSVIACVVCAKKYA